MASPASSTLVPSTSVVRIVEQFLLENNLTKSFEALKEESAVALNAVPGDSVKYALVMNQASASTLDESALAPLLASSSSVFSDVLNGRLDRVLTALAKCELTPTLAVNLYTQVLLELLELKDAQSARMLLRQTRALGQHMKTTQPKQYTRLDQLISRSAALTPADIYGETTRDARQRALVCALAKEVRVVAPGRLLDAVGNGIKYLRVTGRMYELVDATSSRKRTRLAAAADDTPPPPVGWDLLLNTELSPAAKAARRGDGDGGELPAISHANGAHSQSIKFGTDSHPTCASYSPDGFFIATGSSSNTDCSFSMCLNENDYTTDSNISIITSDRTREPVHPTPSQFSLHSLMNLNNYWPASAIASLFLCNFLNPSSSSSLSSKSLRSLTSLTPYSRNLVSKESSQFFVSQLLRLSVLGPDDDTV